jgi:hypothetical protein
MFAALLDKVSLGIPSAYRNLTLTPILLRRRSPRVLTAKQVASCFVIAINGGMIALTSNPGRGRKRPCGAAQTGF